MLATEALRKYVAKLERRNSLPDRERAAILSLHGSTEIYAPNATIVYEGQAATHCVLIETGFVSRVKIMESGLRQIVSFHIAGDAIDLQSLLFVKVDHEMRTHLPTSTFWIAHDDVLRLAERHPIIARALWLDTLVDASIFREWTANVGQRSARERIAHLFLELHSRFQSIGGVTDDLFEVPLTQNHLAEALGLSLVHLNKSLQALKREGLIESKGRYVRIVDRERLRSMCGFSDSYLHLDGRLSKDVNTAVPEIMAGT